MNVRHPLFSHNQGAKHQDDKGRQDQEHQNGGDQDEHGRIICPRTQCRDKVEILPADENWPFAEAKDKI